MERENESTSYIFRKKIWSSFFGKTVWVVFGALLAFSFSVLSQQQAKEKRVRGQLLHGVQIVQLNLSMYNKYVNPKQKISKPEICIRNFSTDPFAELLINPAIYDYLDSRDIMQLRMISSYMRELHIQMTEHKHRYDSAIEGDLDDYLDRSKKIVLKVFPNDKDTLDRMHAHMLNTLIINKDYTSKKNDK